MDVKVEWERQIWRLLLREKDLEADDALQNAIESESWEYEPYEAALDRRTSQDCWIPDDDTNPWDNLTEETENAEAYDTQMTFADLWLIDYNTYKQWWELLLKEVGHANP